VAYLRAGRRASILARLVATAGGAGYSPIAPGTCGTLVALPIVWACRDVTVWPFLGLVMLVTLAGIAAAQRADAVWNTHGSDRIVIDQVAGFLLTVAFVDRSSWRMLLVGLALFRVIDIIKPPPIRWIDENVPGGAGVVLDDVAAGILGALIMIAIQATWRQ
jgi:phosphatidylglycerophosphatase A